VLSVYNVLVGSDVRRQRAALSIEPMWGRRKNPVHEMLLHKKTGWLPKTTKSINILINHRQKRLDKNCKSVYSRAVAQAVSCRPPAAAARGRIRAKSCADRGGQSGTGAGFLRVPRFLLPLIHSTNCSTIITIYHPRLVRYANKWPQ
jgi:hypothetical protein